MSSYLILDWDHNQLRLMSASVKRGQVHVQHALSWADAGTPSAADAENLGKRLRERLKEAGIGAAPVVACVGRDRIIVKELHHPPVPASEEAAMVRFQAVKELTDSPDDIVLDYTPLSDPQSTGERRTLCWVIRKELLTAYQSVCRAAGLKLQGLTPRVFGTIACLRRALRQGTVPALSGPAGATAAVVTVARPWAEFSAVQDERLLYTRSLPAGTTLVSEIRRNLIVYAGQAPQYPIAAIFIAGAQSDPLHDQLRDVMGVPVHVLDPFAGLPAVPAEARPAEGTGTFAGAVGLLQLLAERQRLPINFVEPRQPEVARDPNRRRNVLVAAAAGLVFLGTVGYCYSVLSSRDDEIETLQARRASLDTDLAALDPSLKQLHELDDWSKTDIDWLDEFYDVTALFPDTNRIRLTAFIGDRLPPRTTKDKDKDKDPHVAVMTLQGVARSDGGAVNELLDKLEADPKQYRTFPIEPKENTGPDKSQFPLHFTTRVEVEKTPPRQFVRRLRVATPRTEDDNGGFGGFGGFGGMGGFGDFGGNQP